MVEQASERFTKPRKLGGGKLFSEMTLRPGIAEESLEQAQRILAFTFPADFKEFLLFSNGAVGEIGNEYIEIWSLEDILHSNKDMEIETFAPGLIAFGCDGANELYAFDTRDGMNSIVQVPMIGMDLQNVWYCSESFETFLTNKLESR